MEQSIVKNKMKLIVFLVAVIFAQQSFTEQKFTRLTETSSGSCPNNFTYVTSLDPEKMQGTWYGHYLSYTKLGSCDGHCWTSFAVRASNTSLGISICCQKDGKPLCGSDTGSLTIEFNENKPGVAHKGDSTADVYYLDIKFDEYVIGIVCAVREDKPSKPFVYVSRRTKEVPDGFEELVMETLRRNGVDTTHVSKVLHHDQCKYIHDL